ncbi:endonuclease/exonuclease/phosphatase family protein [Streptomyces spongiae]|uniref:Endonuclease/exonuclease/phosphatase family protein n=1 Tax=Streptomyces spongiae TaxID=565072 RepID=A0A5N8XVI1_9ACTN|nr:endonuclease/exonuclease/phosphatase family protein [Streptomyces spongiae]MPY63390.1 endonuclease/exonuclease/phosphatase family protein [Streptomyces spongiae]
MTIRIGTFNAENLFRRPKAFALDSGAERRRILEDFTKLVALLDLDVYTAADQRKIAALITKHHADDDRRNSPRPFFVNQTRGGAKLYTKPRGGEIKIVAEGRPHWTGWAELVRDDLAWEAVENTGRVIAEVDADILLTVEVEDRLTLDRFNTQVLGDELGATPYPFNMLVDGNDSRGIDVGILSRHPITSVRPHLFDPGPSGVPVFSRDCPEFEIRLGNGETLWILGNHFKSKGFGNAQENDERRKAQADRVRQIYEAALEHSAHVVVAGDLNDTPDSAPVTTLLNAGLQDAMSHPAYTGDPGTYETGTRINQKIDYVMLSPKLWDTVEHVNVERRGVYAPRTFKSFLTVTSKANQASDHAALYADLDI